MCDPWEQTVCIFLGIDLPKKTKSGFKANADSLEPPTPRFENEDFGEDLAPVDALFSPVIEAEFNDQEEDIGLENVGSNIEPENVGSNVEERQMEEQKNDFDFDIENEQSDVEPNDEDIEAFRSTARNRREPATPRMEPTPLRPDSSLHRSAQQSSRRSQEGKSGERGNGRTVFVPPDEAFGGGIKTKAIYCGMNPRNKPINAIYGTRTQCLRKGLYLGYKNRHA